MGDKHDISFFGQSTGLIFNTSKYIPHSFMRAIKKKENGVWEKPSLKEGKVVKISLIELIAISKVLDKKSLSWSAFHTFAEKKTTITFAWEDRNAKKLWVNIDNYSKMIDENHAELFRLLVNHLVQEKIEFATFSTIPETT